MGKMSDLYIVIQTELEKGIYPATIASALGINAEMVYDVLEQMEAMDEMPQEPLPTDDEIDEMAKYYGYGQEEYCEFDR